MSRMTEIQLMDLVSLLVLYYHRLVIGPVSSIQRCEVWGVKAPIYMRNLCQPEGQMLRSGGF